MRGKGEREGGVRGRVGKREREGERKGRKEREEGWEGKAEEREAQRQAIVGFDGKSTMK